MDAPTINHDEILNALRGRFDHAAAVAVLGHALRHAGMTVAESYSPAAVCRIAWAVAALDRRAQPAVTALVGLATERATAGMAEEADAFDDREEPPLVGAAIPQIVAAAVEAARLRYAARSGALDEDTADAGPVH